MSDRKETKRERRERRFAEGQAVKAFAETLAWLADERVGDWRRPTSYAGAKLKLEVEERLRAYAAQDFFTLLRTLLSPARQARWAAEKRARLAAERDEWLVKAVKLQRELAAGRKPENVRRVGLVEARREVGRLALQLRAV